VRLEFRKGSIFLLSRLTITNDEVFALLISNSQQMNGCCWSNSAPSLMCCNFIVLSLFRLMICPQVFLYATKEISQSQTPLIHEVIPMFDIITTALDEYIDNTSLHAAVCHPSPSRLLCLVSSMCRLIPTILNINM